MAQWRGLLVGLGLGAAAMYLWDPEHGRVRRERANAHLKKTTQRLRRVAQQGSGGLWVGLQGLQAGWRALRAPVGNPDDTLAARVRRGLKRVLRDASLIDVQAQGGQITLSGSVHAEDAARAVQFARGVSGVRLVENHLEFRH
ncbi:MAG TPA: BON domain-containing protein [Acidiferrobacteraceae bacterium]|nr:BON domain-containing protein [Acidiferrobacteraceae bacterium]